MEEVFMEKIDAFEAPSKGATEAKNEFREFLYFLNRQVFNQIPGVSALAGILAGAWVVSTFTASPIKGTLAEWGVIQGGTHVVSSGMYKFLSFALPLGAASITAYGVQKALKGFREMQIEIGVSRSARLPEDKRAELNGKLAALENAREAGILTWGEYRTKMANLYQPYVRKPSKVEELIVSKVSAKIQ
jgi:hypothetical protein